MRTRLLSTQQEALPKFQPVVCLWNGRWFSQPVFELFSDEIVALKRLKMEKEKEGFPITSLREINTILKAQHPNIVTVRVRRSGLRPGAPVAHTPLCCGEVGAPAGHHTS